MPQRKTLESIFLEAVELPLDQRQGFLDQCCGDDLELRAAVDELIAADQQAGKGEFLAANLFGKDADPEQASLAGESSKPDDSGRFRIIRSYREGGLGEVLLAHDRQLDRDVAVKQIKPMWKDSVEAQQRFIQEAKVTGRLEHPGIVPIYAMGTWPDGQPYYAMRFIKGDTMKDAIDRYHSLLDQQSSADLSRLALRELLAQFVDVCNTIRYAHSKRILHRDIKPSNVMVGPYGETLVVDWGLAKLLDEPAEESMTADLARAWGESNGSTPTQVGGIIGTPHYMSPEQAKGKLDQIGTRTDVYLLGATLYQILTGHPPHKDESVSKLLKRISQGTLVPPREIAPRIAPPLESICLKAMATDSADRYVNPDRIADDVNRWMADQPVSVHVDSNSVRVSRWMRIHRTATSTIAVATLLLAVGGVFGSVLWNVAKVREIKADERLRSKKLELDIKDQQRVDELRLAAVNAENLADKEIDRNRFSSAFDVLSNALPSIKTEDRLKEQTHRIQQKFDRLGAIVDFYRLSDIVEQQNILSRDTKALMACTAGLKRLGIWDRPDWWTGLPAEDLSQQQTDTLRWDIYQQLILMDAMLVKSMGARLIGRGSTGGSSALLHAARRILTSGAGKAEARAAIVVSDRIDRFRVSESTRLYRSIANMRLGTGRLVKGKELGLTHSSADAGSLGVLCVIAFLDPSFDLLFGGYQNDDPLLAARTLFGRATAIRPEYYGTHLGLGQVEYLIAIRNPDVRWDDFASSLHAFGQCITLLPDRCFAYIDRSSVYRVQAVLLAKDERYSELERKQLVTDRLRWSLADASRAMQFYSQHSWIGWQAGQTFAAMGQTDRAIDLWIQTGFDTYALGNTADSTFVRADDLRGRAEIGDWLKEQLSDDPTDSPINTTKGYVALAGLRLNQARIDQALDAINAALAIDPADIDARAILGMILLQQSDIASAAIEFQAVFQANPKHPFAAFGMAVCLENEGRYSDSLSMFQIAEGVVLSSENQAAAALGRGRNAAISGDLVTAEQAVRRAIDAEPACDLLSMVRPIALKLKQWKQSGDVPDKQITVLTKFVKSLADLPRATKIESMPQADPSQPTQASILNGGFELGSMRYWNAATGAQWESTPGFDSSATVTNKVSHSGTHCLRIDAVSPANTVSVTKPADTTLGQTGQRFSVVAGQSYRLECWVKAESLSSGAVRIVSPTGNVVTEFEGGTYGWRRVTGKLRVTTTPQGEPIAAGTIVPYELKIVATDSGTLWLDDLTCRTSAK